MSIHVGSDVDYAYGIRLEGAWNIVQNYAESPCSGAHIWIESVDGEDSYLEITHRRPQSEGGVEVSSAEGVSVDDTLVEPVKRKKRNRW